MAMVVSKKVNEIKMIEYQNRQEIPHLRQEDAGGTILNSDMRYIQYLSNSMILFLSWSDSSRNSSSCDVS